MTVPLRGLHYGANVLGAVAIARLLKIDKSKIMTTIAKLKQPPHQLELKKLKNGVTLIDNSYNTNLDGFLASIEYLKTFPGRTFVVTPGIIELGRFSQKIHSELGQKLKGIDHVWVTNLKHADDLSSPENHVTGEENMNKIFSDMRDTLRKGDTLLIEGRIPESLKSDILKL
ncbi:MAG: hypothetical protein HYS86_00515 [Candidatus Chisholmbacteria bacterium]|nr:hypothetical protein [Candidatus Chisholmbacteria bacterium]